MGYYRNTRHLIVAGLRLSQFSTFIHTLPSRLLHTLKMQRVSIIGYPKYSISVTIIYNSSLLIILQETVYLYLFHLCFTVLLFIRVFVVFLFNSLHTTQSKAVPYCPNLQTQRAYMLEYSSMSNGLGMSHGAFKCLFSRENSSFKSLLSVFLHQLQTIQMRSRMDRTLAPRSSYLEYFRAQTQFCFCYAKFRSSQSSLLKLLILALVASRGTQ